MAVAGRDGDDMFRRGGIDTPMHVREQLVSGLGDNNARRRRGGCVTAESEVELPEDERG